jgi:hypothetical protein
MKATLLYKISSILLVLFALGHTIGFWQVDPSWRADTVVSGMRSVSFPIQGFNRSYWDFFIGFGLFVTVFLLLLGRTPSTIGGERGFIYSPDGRTLAREVNAFDRYRTIAIPDTGAVAILSQEEDLPLVSELIVTNAPHNQGREVQVVTKAYVSQLVGRGSTAVWFQLPRRR